MVHTIAMIMLTMVPIIPELKTFCTLILIASV